MTILTIAEVERRLTRKYPDVIFAAGERSEGFWIKAVHNQGNWAWERWRMASPGGALSFAEVALTEFYGA